MNYEVDEICDNGNTAVDGADGCFNNCTIHPDWDCSCTNGWFSPCVPKCGDGKLVGSELTSGYCDDGNTVSTDGCHNCVVTRLFTCSGEPSVCVNWCGDSILRKNVGELCDNGNSTEDDGCFNNCTVNPKWTCTSVDGQLSVCTPKCGDGYLVGYETE